ncbi:MAG: EutN/CcmL family microcompartment protein [bacterium]|nr:EutN/CcmL family microcompartment protein [bacterium]
MYLGTVIGKVVATRKDPSLTGIRLLVVQPIDHNRAHAGDPFVAADVTSAGQGETVFWVSSREAPNALPNAYGPVDATIVGIADRIDI